MKLFCGLLRVMSMFSISTQCEFQRNTPANDISKARRKGSFQETRSAKNPSDIWDVIKQDWEDEVWDIPNVKAEPSRENRTSVSISC